MTSLRLLGFLIAAILIPSSFGQRPNIGIFKVAFDEPTNPKEQEYARPIILRIRQPAKIPEDINARLFRGSPESLKKVRPDRQSGCVYFFTAVFPVTVTGTFEIPPLDSPGYLRPEVGGDGFLAEDYTIVFESADETSPREIFINQKELDNYFRYAFCIRLLPPGNLKSKVAETVRVVTASLRSAKVPALQETGIECWNVKPVLLAGKTRGNNIGLIKVAEFLPCREAPKLFTAAAGGW